MPRALFERLSPIFDETFALASMNGQANWRPNGFGRVMRANDIRVIIPHVTAGWPSRNKGQQFVDRYTTQRIGQSPAHRLVVPCRGCPGPALPPNAPACTTCHWGVGPQYYISSDGTVARVIGDQNVRTEERRTIHAGHTNDWAIGVETGNLFEDSVPPGANWIPVSQSAEDIPGAKLWIRDHRDNPREVIACWWTTANWQFPMREPVAPANAVRMLFTEAQYRAWGLLGRFLAEQFDVPRNFPVLPHAQRNRTLTAQSGRDEFRSIMLADPIFDTIVQAFSPTWNIGVNEFASANTNALGTRYAAQTRGTGNRRTNDVWTRMIENYRGFHGHAFSGDNAGRDHDCPGPLFDWHRFAREVWDWWWFPFDLSRIVTPIVDVYSSAGLRRPYRQPDGDTRLVEYYWDAEDPNEPNSQHSSRVVPGMLELPDSPTTFRLDPDSPVYAVANGELVAARFAQQPAGSDSMSFALVRHEVFHSGAPTAAAGATAPAPGRIDYDLDPDTIYTLYMHLGAPTGMSFDQVNEDNPDWLNRVIIRFKECRLGVLYVDGDSSAVPPIQGHTNPPAAAWNSVPPGNPTRPTLLNGWRADAVALFRFLDQLRSGEIALAPTLQHTTPIRILLGDFLGNSGPITLATNQRTQGIRVETFTASFIPPGFVQTAGWNTVPPGTSPHMTYASEWAREMTTAERAGLEQRGVEPALVTWWPTVAAHMSADPRAFPANVRLPPSGNVVHLRPLDVISWINNVTWRSEWPKYSVAGPVPPRPRSRRV